MGKAPTRQDDDLSCVRKIFRSWSALNSKFRPIEPKALMAVLRDLYQYPRPDFLPPDKGRQELTAAVDAAYDAFRDAVTQLREVLPQSDHWDVLATVLEERFPLDADEHMIRRQLAEVESVTFGMGSLVQLQPRPKQGRTGRPIKNAELRVLVQAICWYIDRVEGLPIKSGFKDDTSAPTSRAARMIEATCLGMGLEVPKHQIKTHLDAARQLDLSRLSHWDLIDVLPGSRLN